MSEQKSTQRLRAIAFFMLTFSLFFLPAKVEAKSTQNERINNLPNLAEIIVLVAFIRKPILLKKRTKKTEKK